MMTAGNSLQHLDALLDSLRLQYAQSPRDVQQAVRLRLAPCVTFMEHEEYPRVVAKGMRLGSPHLSAHTDMRRRLARVTGDEEGHFADDEEVTRVTDAERAAYDSEMSRLAVAIGALLNEPRS